MNNGIDLIKLLKHVSLNFPISVISDNYVFYVILVQRQISKINVWHAFQATYFILPDTYSKQWKLKRQFFGDREKFALGTSTQPRLIYLWESVTEFQWSIFTLTLKLAKGKCTYVFLVDYG
jgi:hypothetical protein